MDPAAKTIPIISPTVESTCGACLHGADGRPVCRSALGQACEAPQLSGPPADLQRVLAALAPVLGGSDASGTGVIKSLQLQPGEASLTLAVAPHCGGAALADAAFQVLRGLLPDTDIYVKPGT